jgi:hypothetical protein
MLKANGFSSKQRRLCHPGSVSMLLQWVARVLLTCGLQLPEGAGDVLLTLTLSPDPSLHSALAPPPPVAASCGAGRPCSSCEAAGDASAEVSLNDGWQHDNAKWEPKYNSATVYVWAY